ncbi:MAG: ribosomal protein S18-alanine N-acetyltransferase [Ruminococcus sp.]|nr:ribosomal protein S18-alanine N-acetyltransferase [Ruminococcus sp.]
MTIKFQIRDAIMTDLTQIIAIAAHSSDPWSEAVFQQTLKTDTPFWVAIQDTEVIGFLSLSFCGDVISVDNIAVAPSVRRQGVAKALLQKAINKYHGREFWLEVRQSNVGAVALYQSLGFIQTGLRRQYYQNLLENAILMTKIVK